MFRFRRIPQLPRSLLHGATITLSKISVSDPDGIAQSKTISFQIEQNLQPGETLNVTVQKQGGAKLNAAATQSGNSTNYSVEVSEDGTYEVTATISKDNVVLDTKKESIRLQESTTRSR